MYLILLSIVILSDLSYVPTIEYDRNYYSLLLLSNLAVANVKVHQSSTDVDR